MNKVLRIILIILLIGICATALGFAIKGTTDSKKKTEEEKTSGYTNEDLQNAYNQGYAAAGGDKVLLDEIRQQNADLNHENLALIAQTRDLTSQVAALTNERDALLTEREILNENLDQNRETINSLNSQIATLNAQIASLNETILNNYQQIGELNSRIAELQRTIAFYEQFVVQFETEDQALVTFEFAGSVIDGKVVNKGDRVTTATPASTEFVIFNGWMVDGEPIDLSTYVVMNSVRIVADVTYRYLVSFKVGDDTKYSQVVESGQYATVPTPPKKTGYTFKYWTLDGENEVDVEQITILANTVFYAKFNQLFTVDFVVDGNVMTSRRIENGSTTRAPANVSGIPEGMAFVQWTLNGTGVIVEHVIVESDLTFVAELREMEYQKFATAKLEASGGDGEAKRINFDPVTVDVTVGDFSHNFGLDVEVVLIAGSVRIQMPGPRYPVGTGNKYVRQAETFRNMTFAQSTTNGWHEHGGPARQFRCEFNDTSEHSNIYMYFTWYVAVDFEMVGKQLKATITGWLEFNSLPSSAYGNTINADSSATMKVDLWECR